MFANDWTENYDAFDSAVDSKVIPRWKRKAMEKANAAANASTTAITAASSLTSTPSRGSKRRGSGTPHADRFIPNRAAMDMQMGKFALQEKRMEEGSPAKEEYTQTLQETLLNGRDESAKILAFKSKAPAPPVGYQNSLKVLYSQNKANVGRRRKVTRHIPQAPERVLDAPDMLDDYYLNLLDWNKQNVLAVALGQTVYLWNAESGSITELCTTEEPENFITSLSWIGEGSYLAVGTNSADVQLWDTEALRQVRCMKGHQARVSALDWNQFVLSSGSRDSNIINHDVRVADHHIATLDAHTQEVCGLKWSPDGTQLASGGNDNLLCVWDINGGAGGAGAASEPRFKLADHCSAVKALDWCPWQENLLASGGGTADRCIRFWNSQTGACLNTIDTKSQVCSLKWSTHHKEIVSSHGFSQNQLIVWKYPSMVKMAELTGHTSRVLHLASSPDGETIVSAAGDETLRFWHCFGRDDAGPSSAKPVLDNRGLRRNVNIR